MSEAYSILGDWGTSRLRLYRMQGGVVVDRITGPGIGAIAQAPADVLRQAMAPWLSQSRPERIMLCGMAGSRNGLLEVGYADCPADVRQWSRQSALYSLDGNPVQIMAGLACTHDGVPDVMRGEETQIFGALALQPALAQGAHILVLPGTHSKWAWLDNGHVIGFRTCLSGELFALLNTHSTLLRAGGDDGDPGDGFAIGGDSAKHGQGLLGSLFHARSAQLRSGRSPAWARAYLSGLIIGHEIREMLSITVPGAPISLIGDPELNQHYAKVLQTYELSVTALDGEQCAIAGLLANEESP